MIKNLKNSTTQNAKKSQWKNLHSRQGPKGASRCSPSGRLRSSAPETAPRVRAESKTPVRTHGPFFGKADISTGTAQFIGGGICELKRCHLRDETYASSLAQPSLLAHKARYLWFSLPPIRSMMPAASMRSCGLPTFSF